MEVAVHQLKIAAAIAVLRSKPAGADVREYTEQLCAKYLKAQTKWRTCYLQAKDALVHLQQQQIICSIQQQQDEYSVRAEAGDVICPVSPPSSTPGTDTSVAGPAVPLVNSQQALTSSYHFIHSVVNLTRAVRVQTESSKTDNPEEAGTRASTLRRQTNLESLLAETVPTCVRHLKMVISQGHAEVSTNCVIQGLDGLILLLNSDWTDRVDGAWLRTQLLKELGGLVDCLLQRLFEPGEDDIIQCVPRRQLLHKMLLHLTTNMRALEKYSLLQSLAVHAQNLCHIVSDKSTTNPSFYECLVIALDCIQQGVSSLKVGELHSESLRELQVEMEGLLDSNLMCRFPLVAGAILRLTSVMELCAKTEVLY